jgi:two-component system chemotaxis sensor kinase CheA
MFITIKRAEREKQESIGAGNRLSAAILKHIPQGLLFVGADDKILPQTSRSLARLFRRRDFSDLTFEQLLKPMVTAKTWNLTQDFLTMLRASAVGRDVGAVNPLKDVEVRLTNADGSFDSARFAFDFNSTGTQHESGVCLVQVTDITESAQQTHELEDLRTQVLTQGQILRSILQVGAGRFAAFLQRTDVAMQTINKILKKPAREEVAFRNKLEETLNEVDRVRRDGVALQLTALEAAARHFEDSLHQLRSRSTLSGGDFLPLAVKLDELYGQFAVLRSLTANSGSAKEEMEAGTQIIEAPKFAHEMEDFPSGPGAMRSAPAGSLDSTLMALTEHIAVEHKKTVTIDCSGLHMVPPRYQATVKNIAIQLIRNAVVHGIETPAMREIAAKPLHGTLQIEFKALADGAFELSFQDDGRGLNPDQVRRTAVAKGLITREEAAMLRDRQVIKLIFKAGFTTLAESSGAEGHGTGMSLVRRYVHDAGGRISLASLPGHETRFRVSLPALGVAEAQVA